MIEDSKKELQKDTEILYKKKEDLEKVSISSAKKELTAYLKKKDIKEFVKIIEESSNILSNIERNKNLPQSILNKDIETLENNLDELQKIV
jgi:mevalonate pyrophosphate decarboxylase